MRSQLQRMMVSDNKPPKVLSAMRVRSVEVIDGGDTLAVRLRAPDDDEFCIVLPIGTVGDLLFQLAEVMNFNLD
jgi:hypothetical protein